MEYIVELSKIVGALGIIFGVVIGFVRWLSKQENQSEDIERLSKHQGEDINTVQQELCVVNYAILACLDALMQKGYDGKVSQAHERLQKHINQKAHGQEGR